MEDTLDDSFQYYRVEITIHRAQNLPIADLYPPSSDPYIIVQVDDHNLGKTESIIRNLNPIYERNFSINRIQLNEQSNLKFIIYDEDQTKEDDLLGEINLPLYSHRNENVVKEFVKPLEQKGKVTASGSVHFSVFIKKLVKPTPFSLALTIHRAENLPGANFFPADSSDPFMVVSLNGNTVAVTTTEGSINPSFEQTFEIPIQSLEQSVLILKVYDWNKFVAHKILGVVTVPLPKMTEINKVNNFTKPLEQASEGRITARGSVIYSLLLTKNADESAPDESLL